MSVLCLAWVGCEDQNPAKTGDATEKPGPYGAAAGEARPETPDETEPEVPAGPKTDSVPGGAEGQGRAEASPKPETEDGFRGKAEHKMDKSAEPAAPVTPWTVADAGFASRVPAATDYYLDARKLGEIWKWLEEAGALAEGREFLRKSLEESGLPKEILGLLTEGIGAAPDLLGEEVFLAGQGMTWTLETAVGVNTFMNRVLGEALAGDLAAGNMEFFLDEGQGMEEEMVEGLGKWFESQLEKEEGFPKASLYAGGRVRDGERRAEVVQWVKGALSLAVKEMESARAISFERGGANWTGFEIKVETLEGLRDEDAPEGFDTRAWQHLLKQIGKWSVVVACAEIGDYVVMAAGNGQESIEVVGDTGASLASSKAFRFFEQFPAEEVVSLCWWSRELSAASQKGVSYLPFFEGALEGLKGSQLKRGEDMVEALKDFNRNWQARRTGEPHDFTGTVLVGDDIRLEGRGGWLGAGLDLKVPLRFAKAFSALEKVPFVRAHWKMNPDYVRQGNQQVDAGMRLLKLVVDEVMEALGDEAEGNDEEEQAVRWKRDLSRGLNDILRGYREYFSKAFGEEGAFVMDLQGEMIPAIGVEEDVIRKGRIPRAAYIKPVLKREALSESWDIWEKAFTNLFGVLAETLDQPIPFPSTMTAEKDDLRTYFFPLPFATDDFLPSVSVSDDLYILGTSKGLSESLYEAALKEKGGEKEAGLWVEVDTGQLWDFCGVWIDFYEESQAAAADIEEDELKRADQLLPVPEQGPDFPREEELEFDVDELPDADQVPVPDKMMVEDPFGALFSFAEPELLRGWLDKVRILRGIRVHRRMEEEMPRTTVRIRVER